MRRLDLYLTRKAQATWPESAVYVTGRGFLLERPGREPVLLAGEETPQEKRFRTARDALALLRKQR